MKKVLISLVLLIATISVYAADWQPYEEKGFFIDKSSITKNNNSIKAWILIVGHGELNKKKYAYIQSYKDAKCSENKMAYLETVYYSKKHYPIASYNFEANDNVEFNRIIPDSRGEAIYNALCH